MLQNSKEEENIIKECLENNLETLTVGANSSHVVQKVIKAVKEPNRDYINTYIISNLIDLCLIYPKNVVNDNLYMCSRKKENIEKTISTINSILVFKELAK